MVLAAHGDSQLRPDFSLGCRDDLSFFGINVRFQHESTLYQSRQFASRLSYLQEYIFSEMERFKIISPSRLRGTFTLCCLGIHETTHASFPNTARRFEGGEHGHSSCCGHHL